MTRYLPWIGFGYLLVLLVGCQTSVAPTNLIDWSWSYRTGDYIRAKPSSADDVVYVGSDDNSMHAVDARTGETLWTFETADNVTSSAATDEDGVYFGSWDGAIYALDAEGQPRWHYQTDGWVSASPVLYDGILYVGSHDGNFYALDSHTGEVLWQYTTNGRIEADAVLSDDLAIIGSTDGYLHALDRDSGQRQWFFHTDDPIITAPADAGERLFATTLGRTLYALDRDSGELIWSYVTDASMGATPVVDGDTLFVGNEGGQMVALSTADGKLIWQQTIDEPIRSGPAIWNGLVFVATSNGNLYELDSVTGALLWRYRLGGSITQGPTISGDRLYVGSTAKNLEAFDLHEGQMDKLEPFAPPSPTPFEDAHAAEGNHDIIEYQRLWAAIADLPDIEAVRSLQDVIAYRPQSPAAYHAYVALARYYAEQEASKATDAYQAALALDDNMTLRLELARTLESQGDSVGAYDAYQLALRDGGPAGADAFAGMRRTGSDPLLTAEDLSDALYYTDVLETLRGVDVAAAVPLRAEAYMGLGRFQEAANAYRQMLRADPNDKAAVKGLALAVAWLGDGQAALDLYATVDSPESRVLQAQLLAADEPELALEYYLESPDPAAWWSATALLESQGRYTETLPIYARLAETNIQYADDAAYRLFVLGRRMGDAEAEERGRALLAERGMNWLALRSGDNEPEPSTMPTLAMDESLLLKVDALEQTGHSDLARQELVFASRFRKAPETLLVIAQALAERGDVVAAQRIAEQYIHESGEAPLEFWELSFPRPYSEIVNTVAEEYGVDPYLIWAVMREESRFDPDAMSYARARGLMQVIPSTQMWIADELGESMAPGDAYDVETSIRMGAWLLGFLTRYFDSDQELAIPAYNAGAGAVEGWQSNALVADRDDMLRWIGYDETRLYLKRVALSHQVYHALYPQE